MEVTERSANMRSLSLTFVLFFSCHLANAQQPDKTPAQVPQHLENLASAPPRSKEQATPPSTELQSLIKALSGKWSVAVSFESNSAMPNEVVGTGEETW